jgi:hypothetical protein
VGENQHIAARVLGLGGKILYRRLEEYRLPYDQFDLFLCPQAFSPVKTTRISMPPLLHLVNPIFLVCLSAFDAQAPIAST